MNVNFAERAHNHNWKLDPIVRSLLDTDFYKFLMLQFIWKNFPKRDVVVAITNRTVGAPCRHRAAREIAAQMDYVGGCGSAGRRLVWLAGNTFYGVRQIFEPGFLDWLGAWVSAVGLRDLGNRMVNSCCGSLGCGPRSRCGRSTRWRL